VFVNETAWEAEIEIAVVPFVWMFNTPVESAVVFTPALPEIAPLSALIMQAIS
jgi:hypothetical protein